MDTMQTAPGEATIRLSLTELRTVSNALNEICNGLDIAGFAARIGVEREEAGRLLDQVHALVTRMEQREAGEETAG